MVLQIEKLNKFEKLLFVIMHVGNGKKQNLSKNDRFWPFIYTVTILKIFPRFSSIVYVGNKIRIIGFLKI